MDQMEVQNQKNLSQFIKSAKFLKRVTKLLVSVSVFSLLFSHPAWVTLLHSFNFYFSTLPIRLFSHTLDKNCIFLLCNGLLVFLAKYSGLFSSSSSKYNLTNEYFKHYEDLSRPTMIVVEPEAPSLEKEETQLESTVDQTRQNAQVVKRETEEVKQEKQEEREAESILVTWEGEKQSEAAAEKDEEEEEKEVEEPERCVMEEVLEHKEDEEEEANGMLSNEELNKKFDDFIRKMKEELRIEARQQLIMV